MDSSMFAPPNNTIGADNEQRKKQQKKGKNKKKKNVSKHVRDAQERKQKAAVEANLINAAEGTTTPAEGATPTEGATAQAEVSKTKPKKIKTPEEAASYLSSWNLHKQAVQSTNKDAANNSNIRAWKFDKNTQSWLIRHAYDVDKVAKGTFGLLSEYLSTGNEGCKRRVVGEANRRARRYKDWEKKNGGGADDGEGEDDDFKGFEFNGGEQKLWDAMDAANKRKEYKRARKIIDALKQAKK